jgi:hypothetical protein
MDKTDAFMLKYHPSLVYQAKEDHLLPLDKLGALDRPMDDYEFFDYKKKVAKNFGALIEAYVKTNPEENDVEPVKLDADAKKKLAKAAAKQILAENGESVDLESKEYVKKLSEKAEEIAREKDKITRIKNNISALYQLSEDAAMYETIDELKGVHEVGALNDVEIYKKTLEMFQESIK